MKPKKNETCKVTGKSILSEAQASRKVNQYDDIKSYYYCQHCNGYHLTSKSSQDKLRIIQSILSDKGIDLSITKISTLVKTFRNYTTPISKRPGLCLDNIDEFIKHVNDNTNG